MRRFSQRNSLVTLNDINITPLLDLAFVLLIIFVITTPLLEKGIDLKLPTGVGSDDKQPVKKDIRSVDVTMQGTYLFEHIPMTLEQMSQTLEKEFRANPNLLISIRADENGKYKGVAELLGKCQQLGITRYSLRTDPRAHR